ncbi:hypothetical protein K458DRAFT_416869 [Lentithecium fluviatile CBS 122367]|uniref:Uncharacterized protein n=1 Tax=Lentithecium fluviatile CBS 122367 TaxID=1168545 RepID=A0A6G1J548_9PLEO|nr:hypothetical protein K458DRAFT_416869 [Lentithecium fluviatile CBS 122367]
MAQVFDVLSDLNATGRALETFARQTREWRILSHRLFDIRDGLDAGELSLDAWQRKFEIPSNRHSTYPQALFGYHGLRRIEGTLQSVNTVAHAIRNDINSIVGQALKVRPLKDKTLSADLRYSDQEVESCLDCIRRKPTKSRKFVYCAFKHTDDLETHLEQLHRKLTLLERLSDSYLDSEHPDLFHGLRRLPGRRDTPKPGHSRDHVIQQKLLDGLSARKDAELLHRASNGNHIHIGLAVPQIHRRDFAFLLSLNGEKHEVLMHPVKIKAVSDSSRVQREMATAIPALLQHTHESCYMLPSASSSAGFQVSSPPSTILSNLEFKYPLSTLIRERNDCLTHQFLHPHDQSALACGVAHNTYRLIGSPWLDFLDSHNVRCRKNAAGQWTSMLCAAPADTSITDAVEQYRAANLDPRDRRDITKHMHIFRIGLVLAEFALQSPIGTLSFNPITCTIDILVPGPHGRNEVVEVEEIAAEVERKTNVFLGNMVAFCLSVLRDDEGPREKSAEHRYFEEVLEQAEELEGLMREWRRGSPGGSVVGSVVGTPRSSRSVRSGNVYVY